MRRIFKGYRPGDICTGAIHRFNLQSSPLRAAGVIGEITIEPVMNERNQVIVQSTQEWVFHGFK
jgi:hypothetical protein